MKHLITALLLACVACGTHLLPVAYGGELAVCDKQPTLEKVEECCVDVQTRYNRDTSICFLDGGREP